MEASEKKAKKISYAKWGYIFIISFFVVYAIFTLIPQIITIYDSFFDYAELVGQLTKKKAPFCGFKNYAFLLSKDADVGYVKLLKYFWNTVWMWFLGAVPQMVIALLLALVFTGTRLKLKGLGFFKTVFYMPNLIMASAFAALFLMLFGTIGPIHLMFENFGWINSTFDFILNKHWSRALVAFLNFLMWFGNTTILLMAGIQSIDESLFESARIDGANSTHVLFDITLPLLRPIVIYVFITSMIGGLQMYDVPQVLTYQSHNYDTFTIVMFLNDVLKNNNYGYAGAISVLLFLITGGLSLIVYKFMGKEK